jgi:CPA2 family monovalent cation:H+ antiporter-2
MHNVDLILTLALGLVGALGLGYIAQRLGWTPMVGYLIAGVLLSPNTPGWVANRPIAEQLAEVGVILLMFGVGLHFHLKDLIAVRGVAIAGALVQSATATALGAIVIHALGWSWSSGVVFGLALSVASTVVLIRVLSDAGQLHTPTGRIAVGWLVVEDIFTVFVLVLLPVVFASASAQAAGANLPLAIATAAVKLALLTAFTLIAGGRFLPWLLRKVAETRSRELFTLAILAIALGIAVASSHFFGVSMALGAFLAGMVVGQSEFSARAGAEALPMRDAFAVMFFLSVGLLFDPRAAVASPLPILITLAIVLVGKPLAAMIIVVALGYGSRVALGVAAALAQIGEFSFLLADVATDLGALPAAAMNPLVATAIISIIFSPAIYRTVEPLEAYLKRHRRLWAILNRRSVRERERTGAPISSPDALPRAVVVGYGPIGRLVSRILRDRGIEPTVIEMNISTYRHLRSEGVPAVYGDASQSEVLQQAGTAGASSLIVSASPSAETSETIRIARELNPDAHIAVRTNYLREREPLYNAGADEVFSGEGEVALALADSIARRLGASEEQLEETRRRIRADVLGLAG